VELKRAQQEQAIAGGGGMVNAAAAREEQVKLGKQMRIQNKAKFVSKRIKDSPGAAQSDIDLSRDLSRGGAGGAGGRGAASSKGGTQPASLLLPSLSAVSETASLSADPCPESLLPAAVVDGIRAMTAEADLRELQRQVMVEKRKIRLEQRQTGGDPQGAGGTAVAAASEGDLAITKRLSELTAKDAVILEQIDKVMHKDKEEPMLGGEEEEGGGGDGSGVIHIGRAADEEPLPAAVSATSPPAQDRPLRTVDSSASMVSRGSRAGSAPRGDVFQLAEALLQGVKAVVQHAQGKGHPSSPAHQNDSSLSLRGDAPSQSIILLELKLSELLKRMPQQSHMDPVGYRDKLRAALLQLEAVRHQKAHSVNNAIPVTPVAAENKSLSKQRKVDDVKSTSFSAASAVREEIQSTRLPCAPRRETEGSATEMEGSATEPSGASGAARSVCMSTSAQSTDVKRQNAPSSLYQMSSSFTMDDEQERVRPVAAASACVAIGAAVYVTEHVSEERRRQLSSGDTRAGGAGAPGQAAQHSSMMQVESISEEIRTSAPAGAGAGGAVRQEVSSEVTNERSLRSHGPSGGGEGGGGPAVNMSVQIEMEEVVEDFSDDDLEEDPYASIPGWTDCLNTTMATAAHHAAFYGYADVLELLSKYFDVFVMDDKGRTPLFYAALRNQLAAVTMLVSIGE
jgi:hypothetical protein